MGVGSSESFVRREKRQAKKLLWSLSLAATMKGPGRPFTLALLSALDL